MEYLKKIQGTNEKNYISGYYSLNCPDENGIIADWHPRYYWFSDNKDEKVPLYNTTDVLGNYGIKKRKIQYSDEKVYIADFVRALADMILLQDNISEFRFCSKEYLSDDIQVDQLYDLLLKINNIKDITWFLKEEFPKLYYK